MKKLFVVLVVISLLVSACDFPSTQHNYKITFTDGSYVNITAYVCKPEGLYVSCYDGVHSSPITSYGNVEKVELLDD